MAESQTADEDAWDDIQDSVQADEDAYRNFYATERYVRDDGDVFVIACRSDAEYETIADEAGVPNGRVRELMHDRADDWTDYNWGYSYPVVIEQ